MTKRELARLKELRELLEIRPGTSFSAPERRGYTGNWPERGEQFTGDVREQTRVWRETWVFPILDEIIEKYEKRGL